MLCSPLYIHNLNAQEKSLRVCDNLDGIDGCKLNKINQREDKYRTIWNESRILKISISNHSWTLYNRSKSVMLGTKERVVIKWLEVTYKYRYRIWRKWWCPRKVTVCTKTKNVGQQATGDWKLEDWTGSGIWTSIESFELFL